MRRLPVLAGTWLPPSDRVYPDGLALNQEASAAFGGVGTRVEVSRDSVLPYERQMSIVADGRAEMDRWPHWALVSPVGSCRRSGRPGWM